MTLYEFNLDIYSAICAFVLPPKEELRNCGLCIDEPLAIDVLLTAYSPELLLLDNEFCKLFCAWFETDCW